MATGTKERRRSVLERNKLFATTSVAGFGLIQSSKVRIEIILWYIIIVVFFAFTVRSLVILTDEYLNQQPATTVELEAWDGNISDLGMKMEFLLPTVYDEFYDDGIPYPFPIRYNRSLTDDLEETLKVMNTTEKIMGEKADWPYIWLPLLNRYVFLASVIARRLTSRIHDIETTDLDYYKKYYHMENIFPFMQKFLDHCKRLEIRNDDLIQQWFKQIMNWVFTTHTSTYNQWNKLKSEPLDIPVHLMVTGASPKEPNYFIAHFRIKNYLLPFLPPSHQKYYWWYIKYNQFIDVLLESGVLGKNIDSNLAVDWYMDHIRKPAVLTVYDNLAIEKQLATFKIGRRIKRKVKNAYSFHSINESCSRTTPQWICQYECHEKFITKYCNCSSLYSEHHVKGVEICSPEKYLQCEKVNFFIREEEQKHCTEQCPESCIHHVIEFSNELENRRAGGSSLVTGRPTRLAGNATLILQLQPSLDKRPVFREVRAITSASFWADIGGAFDFWIGASVISALHLIVYFVKQFLYAWNSKTKTGKNIRLGLAGFRGGVTKGPTELATALALGMVQRSGKDDHREINSEEIDENELITIEQLRQEIRSLKSGAQVQQQETETLKQTVQQLNETLRQFLPQN